MRRFLSGCVRGGKLVGISTGSWCAAFVGWTDASARGEMRLAGDDAEPPCRWRAAVWELVADARAAGAWREPAEYSPLPGDLAVFRRAGGDPRHPGQEGHVGRVETAPDEAGRYRTVDGNAGNRVARVERSLSDPDIVGWVSYRRPAVPPAYHVDTEDLAAGAAALGLDRAARESS